MRSGEAVIDNSGWTERILPPAIVGVVVFLFTKLWDTWQFDKRLAEIRAQMITKDDLRSGLADFRENHVQPLKERVSKSEQAVRDMQRDIQETKEIVAAIAAKLDVKVK